MNYSEDITLTLPLYLFECVPPFLVCSISMKKRKLWCKVCIIADNTFVSLAHLSGVVFVNFHAHETEERGNRRVETYIHLLCKICSEIPPNANEVRARSIPAHP